MEGRCARDWSLFLSIFWDLVGRIGPCSVQSLWKSKSYKAISLKGSLFSKPQQLYLGTKTIWQKGLPPGAPIYRRREAAFDEMPFSIPLYLQLLVGLKCLSPFLNVVLPWNSAKFGESFYAEDIYLEGLEMSLTFSKWEFSNYGPQLHLWLN